MTTQTNHEQAVDLLEELSLKKYEAKAFVALTRLSGGGTAKEISDTSEVPRTRVYDAVRVLETKGLTEIQHSNPQRFWAVSIDEAVETLRREYDGRVESLRQSLNGLDPAEVEFDEDTSQEVWAMTGAEAITTRTQQLIDKSDEEVVLVIGDDSFLDAQLAECLQAAHERGVTVIVGAISKELRAHIEDVLPEVDVFVSELEWLSSEAMPGDETEIGRLLLIDRGAILVSSFTHGAGDGQQHEQAIFGRGFDNGVVTVARRLMVTGLLSTADSDYGDGGHGGRTTR